jgi:hypothetical protein
VPAALLRVAQAFMDTTMIGPPVEYREVAALPSRKTYPLLNHFVINTVRRGVCLSVCRCCAGVLSFLRVQLPRRRSLTWRRGRSSL